MTSLSATSPLLPPVRHHCRAKPAILSYRFRADSSSQPSELPSAWRRPWRLDVYVRQRRYPGAVHSLCMPASWLTSDCLSIIVPSNRCMIMSGVRKPQIRRVIAFHLPGFALIFPSLPLISPSKEPAIRQSNSFLSSMISSFRNPGHSPGMFFQHSAERMVNRQMYS